MKKNFSIIITISSLLFFKLAAASNLPLDIFPINNYPQSIEFWFNENNDKIYSNDQLYPLKKDSLLVTKTMQAAHYNHLIQNYYGTNLRDSSPWAMPYIVNIVKKYNLALIELRAIQNFTNDPDKSENQQTYAINYIPYTTNWSEEILKNMNLESFMLHKFIYKLQNRAITTTNIALRIVPTDDPVFLNYQIAGEGYPFDNNQASKVDIATPVYVVTTSKDGVWSLIITPYTWGWAPTRSVAYVNNNFIHKWQESIKKYGLLAIIKSNTPILLRTQNILGLKKTSTTKKPAKISYQKQFVYDTAFISAIFPNAKPSSIYSEHMRNSNNNYILIVYFRFLQ